MKIPPRFHAFFARLARAGIVLISLFACVSSNANGMDTNMILLPTSYPRPPNFPPLPITKAAAVPTQDDVLVQNILSLFRSRQVDATIAKATAAAQANPRDIAAYSVRGHVYTEIQAWDKAAQDYEATLRIDDHNSTAKFDLSELRFQQNSYNDARSGFYALDDSELGDLAAYKAFLCDLLAGQDNVAQSELDHFNQVGSNPSYYFGNGAWDFCQHNPEKAQSWLKSGLRIYAPAKAALYVYSLRDIGYIQADATLRQNNPAAVDAPIPPPVNATNLP